jgi:hypothetical protein
MSVYPLHYKTGKFAINATRDRKRERHQAGLRSYLSIDDRGDFRFALLRICCGRINFQDAIEIIFQREDFTLATTADAFAKPDTFSVNVHSW